MSVLASCLPCAIEIVTYYMWYCVNYLPLTIIGFLNGIFRTDFFCEEKRRPEMLRDQRHIFFSCSNSSPLMQAFRRLTKDKTRGGKKLSEKCAI